MRGLKHRHGVAQIRAGRNPNAANLRRQRVRQVVAIQVQRGDDVELLGARQHLLQRDVGDAVLNEQHLLVLAAAVRGVQLHSESAESVSYTSMSRTSSVHARS